MCTEDPPWTWRDSAVEYLSSFNLKVVPMDLMRASYQSTIRWTMQGLTKPFFKCKQMMLATRCSILAVEYVKKLSIWSIVHCCLNGHILVPKFANFDHVCIAA